MDEHEWMRDPERRGEGLVCRNCGVTEAEAEQAGMERRAAAPEAATRECRHHGTVPDDHFPCRAPGETAGQFTNRMLGYWRDV